jgi:CheY-like chemotaxis protein/two-component sensor histidine kinase
LCTSPEPGSESERRKDEYIALLAHELRNLLAPIRYALAALEKPDKSAAQHSYALGVMRRQSAHMSRLLEDLLDISRIARGELDLRRSVTELTMVIATSIEAARPLLDGKHHALSVELPIDAVRLWADPVRLIQVFTNLLINAAKYTDYGGRVELRATQESDCVVVSIRDSGIGIAKEMIPRIFTLFVQDKGARGHAEGGMGIGLALVHGVVSLHGGTVAARSDGPGCGSEFIVRIPIGDFRERQAGAQDPERAVSGTRLKVLVVDDNKDVADTCAMLIELSGHQVRSAYMGREAIDIAEVFRPQVILTDIGLPDIDGYEFARIIRSRPWAKAAVLVAISGWGPGARHLPSEAAGFSHHLTKPIDPRTIESLLASLAADIG